MAILILTCKDESLILDLLGQVPLVHEGDQVAIPGECLNDIALECRIQLAIENDSLQQRELYAEIHRVFGNPCLSKNATLHWALTRC